MRYPATKDSCHVHYPTKPAYRCTISPDTRNPPIYK